MFVVRDCWDARRMFLYFVNGLLLVRSRMYAQFRAGRLRGLSGICNWLMHFYMTFLRLSHSLLALSVIGGLWGVDRGRSVA